MRFFILRQIVGSDAETTYESAGNVSLGEAPRCPACGRFAGMMPWLPPYRVKLRSYGAVIGDVAFGVGDDLLLSAAFVTAWNAAGLRGVEHVDPVEVVSMRPRSLQDSLQLFYLVGLRHATARIDRSHSVLVGPPPDCELCGAPGPTEAILSLRIDEASWEGEDIFMPWGTANIIVTEKVVALASDYGLANVTTIPIEEFRWDPLGKHQLH